VQHRAQRPRVDQPVVGQLDQRERVELLAQPAQRDAAATAVQREAAYRKQLREAG